MTYNQNPAFAAELHRRIAAGVEAAGKEIVSQAVTKIETAPRGGQNLNRFGQARSAPGEVFASEEGTYRAAIGLNRAAYNVMQVVLDEDSYPGINERAALLEHGGRKLQARPLWEPTLLEAMPDMARAFETAFKR